MEIMNDTLNEPMSERMEWGRWRRTTMRMAMVVAAIVAMTMTAMTMRSLALMEHFRRPMRMRHEMKE